MTTSRSLADTVMVRVPELIATLPSTARDAATAPDAGAHEAEQLKAAIQRFIDAHQTDPKPFVWTADPDAIIEKVRRGKQTLESIH